MGYAGLLIEDAPDDADLCSRAQPVLDCGSQLNALIGALPRSGPFPPGWMESLQIPLWRLETVLAELKACASAPPEDVAHIETARGRLLTLLSDLTKGDDVNEPAPDAATVAHAAATPPSQEPTTGVAGSILVVDDNDLNRDLLGRRLQQLGYQVDQAGDGDTALRMLRRQSYDLMLLDIIMPGLDGYQVLERLQAEPDLARLPVLVISALTEMDSVARCINLGAVDFLPKNVDPVVLRARVLRSVEQKHARDRELTYLQDVTALTAAAARVRDGLPADADAIASVSARSDDLGELARAFGRMVHEMTQREAALRAQLAEIQRLDVDVVSRSQAVAEITDSEYFQQLRAKAQALRKR
jgi:CheY-like chemotaxis protein